MDHKYLVLNPNKKFLLLYQRYINKNWKRQYLYYDVLKTQYHQVKSNNGEGLNLFEKTFLDEIKRVYSFVLAILKDIEEDLENLNDMCKSDENNSKFHKAIELSVREIHLQSKDCKIFFKLNKFAIVKIAKKYEKLLSQFPDKSSYNSWNVSPSGKLFFSKYTTKETRINDARNKSVDLYCRFFRQTYSELAEDELEFVKEKSTLSRHTKLYLGFKMGLITCMMVWLITDANIVKNNLDFWDQPGLFVYTTAGNLLLFRITWSANIFLWGRYGVNYIPLFGFRSLKSNLLQVTNQTSTLLLIYAVNMMIFFRANSPDTTISHYPFLKYGCPLLLIIWTVCYEFYDNSSLSLSVSRGLFTHKVLYNCLCAPFAVLSFRDIYAADVVTSFTKVIADSLYSMCWLLSGSFTSPENSESIADFGSYYMDCTGRNMVIAVGCIECLPLVIRMLQCFRQYHDSGYKVVFPFLFNALKYILSIVVVLYGLSLNGDILTPSYIVIIVVTTLYKWWWDVVMDWGLGDVLPSFRRRSNTSDVNNSLLRLLTAKNWFLRELLMYEVPAVYYLCIVLDLVLRFLWVVSLMPNGMFGDFVGPQLSFFLGSMEIVRRAMWGVFRLEYEHLKHVTKGTPGFLDNLHHRRRLQFDTTIVDARSSNVSVGSVTAGKKMNEDTVNALLEATSLVSMPEMNDVYLGRESQSTVRASAMTTEDVDNDAEDDVEGRQTNASEA